MLSPEGLNIAIAVGSTAMGALIAVFASKYTTHLTKRLTEETKKIESPDIQVFLFGLRLKPNSKDSRTWYLLHPGDENDIAMYGLDIEIQNCGGSPTGDLVVTLMGNNDVLRDDIGPYSMDITPRVLQNKVRRAIAKIGNFSQVSYECPSLPPRVGAVFQEFVFFQPTYKVNTNVHGNFKDGNEYNAIIEFSLEVLFTLTVIQNNRPPIYFSFGMICAAGRTSDNLEKDLIEKNHTKWFDRWQGIGVLGRIAARLKPPISHTSVFVAFEIEQELKKNNKRCFVMCKPSDKKPNLRGMTMYEPQWGNKTE